MMLSLFAWLALASSAHADDAVGPSSGPGGEPATEWYGWQTLTSDVLTVTSFVLAVELDAVPLGFLSVGSFLLTPPVIHIAHGNWLEAGVSFGVRAGSATLFIAGLAVALSNIDLSSDNDSSSDDNDGAAVVLTILGIAGIFASPFVDAAIAKEPIEDERSAWTVLPWVSPRLQGAGLAVTSRL